MKKYELRVVSKEYRYIVVEAENESDAIDKVWDEVSCGLTCNIKAQDYDTEVYLEGEVK